MATGGGRPNEETLVPLVMGSPLYGIAFATLAVGPSHHILPGNGMGIFPGMVLWNDPRRDRGGRFAITDSSFDHCSGRVSETQGALHRWRKREVGNRARAGILSETPNGIEQKSTPPAAASTGLPGCFPGRLGGHFQFRREGGRVFASGLPRRGDTPGRRRRCAVREGLSPGRKAPRRRCRAGRTGRACTDRSRRHGGGGRGAGPGTRNTDSRSSLQSDGVLPFRSGTRLRPCISAGIASPAASRNVSAKSRFETISTIDAPGLHHSRPSDE